MGDVVSWGLINGVKKNVKDVKNDLSTIKTGVADIQSDMTQLSTDVNDAVENIQTTINNAPAGTVPVPNLALKVESVDEGIKFTYRVARWDVPSGPNLHTDNSAPENTIYDRARGIMCRYKTDRFPAWPDEGTLCFIDEDLYGDYTVDDTFYPVTKTRTEVGFTNNQKYYFSFFTYSNSGTFNVTPGLSFNSGLMPSGSTPGWTQRRSCTWTGTKGTLTVTITQDYDYKTLGEITVTATPTAGGDPVSASRTGAGNVALSLDGGEYTVSFSAPQYFSAPESQTINVVAGINNTASAEFKVDVNLDDCTWDEISRIANDGNAEKYFSIGDTKTVNMKYITKTDGDDSDPVLSDIQTTVAIVGFKTSTLPSSHTSFAKVQFCTTETVAEFSCMYENSYDYSALYNRAYWYEPQNTDADTSRYPVFREYLQNNYSSILPDVAPYITKVRKSTMSMYGSRVSYTYLQETDDYIFPPSAYEAYGEVRDGYTNYEFWENPSRYGGKEKRLPYFSSESDRIMNDAVSKSPVEWCLRTSWRDNYTHTNVAYFTTSGEAVSAHSSNKHVYLNNYYPLCFCIG